MNKQVAWHLLARDIILCVIALHSIVMSSIWLISYGLRVNHGVYFSKYDCSNLYGAIEHGGCSLFDCFMSFSKSWRCWISICYW